MCDGAAHLAIMIHHLTEKRRWGFGRGKNLLDGGAPFYQVYKTKDGKYMTVGAIEPQFYKALMKGLELTGIKQMNIPEWPAQKIQIAEKFASRTRAEWCQIFDGTDACCAPLLDYTEAKDHPHNIARSLMRQVADGRSYEPTPAPRLSRTPAVTKSRPRAKDGQNTREVLKEFGFSSIEIQQFEKEKAIGITKASSKL